MPTSRQTAWWDTERDNIMTAVQAKEYGLVDEVIDAVSAHQNK